jgi:hypothetical protein
MRLIVFIAVNLVAVDGNGQSGQKGKNQICVSLKFACQQYKFNAKERTKKDSKLSEL